MESYHSLIIKGFFWKCKYKTTRLCIVFLMLSSLFIAALWPPSGKGLTSWLLLVIFIVFLLLSHVVPWVRCGAWLYRFLIFAIFLTFVSAYFVVVLLLLLSALTVSAIALNIYQQIRKDMLKLASRPRGTRVAPVLKTIFHQCVISYTCSQSNSHGSVLRQNYQS